MSFPSTLNSKQPQHIPVLKDEVKKFLSIKPNFIIFEGTVGLGGHSTIFTQQLNEKGIYIGVDLDGQALNYAKKILSTSKPTKHFFENNFKHIKEILSFLHIPKIDIVFLDLGWGSHQLEGKGFSFSHDENLDMLYATTKHNRGITARELINNANKQSLFSIIKNLGGERFTKRIVEKIIEERETKEIKTTKQLANLIENVVPKKFSNKGTHPATKTFQALRIAVNDELNTLQVFLDTIFNLVNKKGQVAIISFNELEDRIVKNTFIKWEKEKLGKRLTKKPITPSQEEIKINRRARSSKLRIFEFDYEKSNKFKNKSNK